MEERQTSLLLLCGGVSGAVSRTLTAPFDRVKTILQVSSESNGHNSVRAVLRNVYSQEGVKAFWRGNGLNVVKIAPESACKLCLFEKCKAFVLQDASRGKLSTQERLACGGFSGLCAQVLIYPLELLKTRMAASSQSQSVVSMCRNIVQKEGVRAFYQGMGTSCLGVVPFAAIDLTVYDLLSSRLRDSNKMSNLATVVCASVSCITAASVCYPLQVARTRLQVDGVNGQAKRYKGLKDCLTTMARTEGLRSFYKGFTPTLLKVIPAVSISWVVYENAKQSLGL